MTTIDRLAVALSLVLVACAEEVDPCALPERLTWDDVYCGPQPLRDDIECVYFDEDGDLRVFQQFDGCVWEEEITDPWDGIVILEE